MLELMKRNIHMDRMKGQATTQLTLEEDINISDSKPDVTSLIMEQGDVQIESIHTSNDYVDVKGVLLVRMLYFAKEPRNEIVSMQGTIPFEEKVYMEGITSNDQVEITWELEDLSISLINSRKLGVQALLSLSLVSEYLYDEETAIDLHSQEPVEYRKKEMTIASMVIRKKDHFKVKQEVEIPTGSPNIYTMLWESVEPMEIEFKALNDKISIQGENKVFFMYQGEGEDNQVCHFETTLPFSGAIDCDGCVEGMIPEIKWRCSNKEIGVRPDYDGEERIITFEITLELSISMYQEERIKLLSDVYGVMKEVTAVKKEAVFSKLLTRGNGKCKIANQLSLPEQSLPIRKIIHTCWKQRVESQEIVENAIVIHGDIGLKILYETTEESEPYAVFRQVLPYECVMEAENISSSCRYYFNCVKEQWNVTVIGDREIDVKGMLLLSANIYEPHKERIIDDVRVAELDMSKLNELPGIAIYRVQNGESLWDIGKKYYVPISQLQEINQLSDSQVSPGDKILIVKSNYA